MIAILIFDRPNHDIFSDVDKPNCTLLRFLPWPDKNQSLRAPLQPGRLRVSSQTQWMANLSLVQVTTDGAENQGRKGNDKDRKGHFSTAYTTNRFKLTHSLVSELNVYKATWLAVSTISVINGSRLCKAAKFIRFASTAAIFCFQVFVVASFFDRRQHQPWQYFMERHKSQNL